MSIKLMQFESISFYLLTYLIKYQNTFMTYAYDTSFIKSYTSWT